MSTATKKKKMPLAALIPLLILCGLLLLGIGYFYCSFRQLSGILFTLNRGDQTTVTPTEILSAENRENLTFVTLPSEDKNYYVNGFCTLTLAKAGITEITYICHPNYTVYSPAQKKAINLGRRQPMRVTMAYRGGDWVVSAVTPEKG